MKMIALKPFSQIRWRCIKGAEEWVGTNLTFELFSGNKAAFLNSHPEIAGQIEQQRNFDDGTLLKFHHDDWREYTPMFAECSYTWAMFLRSLKLLCETGEGRPWPDQHRTE